MTWETGSGGASLNNSRISSDPFVGGLGALTLASSSNGGGGGGLGAVTAFEMQIVQELCDGEGHQWFHVTRRHVPKAS